MPPAIAGQARAAPFFEMNHPANLLRSGHPIWMCGMRPFFVLTMVAAIGLLGWWAFVLALGWPGPRVVGGPLVWHVHELVYGFAMAAVACHVPAAATLSSASVAEPALSGNPNATRTAGCCCNSAAQRCTNASPREAAAPGGW